MQRCQKILWQLSGHVWDGRWGSKKEKVHVWPRNLNCTPHQDLARLKDAPAWKCHTVTQEAKTLRLCSFNIEEAPLLFHSITIQTIFEILDHTLILIKVQMRKVSPFLCQGRSGFRWCMNTLAPANESFKYFVAIISICQKKSFPFGDEVLYPCKSGCQLKY